MRDLIGAPLQAACESQQKLAESALEFVTRIGFDEKPADKVVCKPPVNHVFY